MTQDDVQVTFIRPGLWSRIDLFFAEKGQGFNPLPFVRQRMQSILRPEAMSDADLAAFGLRRDEILDFVFEDCFADINRPNAPPDA